MLKKFFQENKVAVLGALAIFLALQIVLMNRSQQNVLGLLAQQSSLPINCYYRLNCPPSTLGEQSTFRCLPILICPTPSIVRPSYYYPTRTPTRYYSYPSPTRYYYYPSSTRYYSYPSPTRTYYYTTKTPTPRATF